MMGRLLKKKNTEDLSKELNPIASALDLVLKTGCIASEAVDIWKNLEVELKDLNQDKKVWQDF